MKRRSSRPRAVIKNKYPHRSKSNSSPCALMHIDSTISSSAGEEGSVNSCKTREADFEPRAESGCRTCLRNTIFASARRCPKQVLSSLNGNKSSHALMHRFDDLQFRRRRRHRDGEFSYALTGGRKNGSAGPAKTKRVSPIPSRARSKRLLALDEAAILASARRYQKQVSSSLKKE